jgi:RsiW-degrading membrane proteinase PrsW (M82 family)
MIDFFLSWFANPSLIGIGLALAFGAVWLVGYWPPFFKKPWLWAVLVISALLSLMAVAFIQIPLRQLAGQALTQSWSQEVLLRWILLAGIPQILLSGLVQEGSKLVPVVMWWLGEERKLDVKTGLIIGAVAGAGFGVFEAVWVHNSIFAAGWHWGLVQTQGYMMLAGFWERFFVVAFHIASTAIAGWGLARGWGWQFYLLAAFMHNLLNYSVVLLQAGIFTIVHVEIYAAVSAVSVTALALWLRWRISEAME